jgi:hypothetical protein
MIDRIVKYPVNGLLVICRIEDTKCAYGRTFYKLVPIAGSGEKWTSKKPGKDLELLEEGSDEMLKDISGGYFRCSHG